MGERKERKQRLGVARVSSISLTPASSTSHSCAYQGEGMRLGCIAGVCRHKSLWAPRTKVAVAPPWLLPLLLALTYTHTHTPRVHSCTQQCHLQQTQHIAQRTGRKKGRIGAHQSSVAILEKNTYSPRWQSVAVKLHALPSQNVRYAEQDPSRAH